jgi:hypothetical protein
MSERASQVRSSAQASARAEERNERAMGACAKRNDA